MLRYRLTHTVLILALGAAATAASADPRAEVLDAFSRAMQSTDYRIEIQGDRRGTPFTVNVDVQMPDRFHMRAPEGEFIIHPAGTWSRQNGQWMKLPMDMSGMMKGYKQPTAEEVDADIADVRFAGEETVRGCPSRNYSFRTTGKSLGSRSGDEMLLSVCTRDGRPIRMQSPGERRGERMDLYYDFDARVDIRPPS